MCLFHICQLDALRLFPFAALYPLHHIPGGILYCFVRAHFSTGIALDATVFIDQMAFLFFTSCRACWANMRTRRAPTAFFRYVIGHAFPLPPTIYIRLIQGHHNLTARFAQDAKDTKKIFFVESGICQLKGTNWQFTIRQNLRPCG